MRDRTLILWGFQGTVDYRAQLGEAEFRKLGFEAPSEDAEVFVSKDDLLKLVDVVEGMGVQVSRAPGGSPLMSALSVASWCETTQSVDTVVRFVGALPAALAALVPEQRRQVLSFAEIGKEICGTLSLEYAPASAKLMLAVPDGRWLDEKLACSALVGMRKAIEEVRPDRVLLGFGGLNKSRPAVADELVDAFRASVGRSLVFVSGNSFKKAPAGAEASFWPDLYRVFGDADAVSLSREEYSQLSQRWGEDWTRGLFEHYRTSMIAVHSPENVTLVAGGRLSEHLGRPEDLLAQARGRASEYAARALTGLGARFDGVLSALIARAWRDGAT